MSHLVLAYVLDSFSGAIHFIFEPRDSGSAGGQVGGLETSGS